MRVGGVAKEVLDKLAVGAQKQMRVQSDIRMRLPHPPPLGHVPFIPLGQQQRLKVLPLGRLQALDPVRILQKTGSLLKGKQVVVKDGHKVIGHGLVARRHCLQPLSVDVGQLQKFEASAEGQLVEVVRT